MIEEKVVDTSGGSTTIELAVRWDNPLLGISRWAWARVMPQAVDWAWQQIANDFDDLELTDYPQINNNEERPCVTCGRKNFITDKQCWWCETKNPTQARAS